MAADHLSTTLAALADPTRRALLARLALGETSVTTLAEPFAMSLTAVSKHLKVLERAGPRSAVAALPPRARPAARGRRLARALSPILGREPRPPRRVPARAAGDAGACRQAQERRQTPLIGFRRASNTGASHAEDHPVPVVRRQGRRGGEFLCLDLQERQDPEREPLRRRRPGAEGHGHDRRVRA